jgi:hypothetical protein
MRALAFGLIALALAAAGCGGDDEVPSLPDGQRLASRHALAPPVQLFAEPVVARIDILLDNVRLDPERVRVVGFFEPYEQEGPTVRTRRDQGRYTHLRYEFTLRCLVYECLPGTDARPPRAPRFGTGAQSPRPAVGEISDRKVHRLRPARILYDDPQQGTRRLRNLTWPRVVSASRLNLSSRETSSLGFPFKASVTPVHETTYRAPPALLGAGLLAGALALLTVPGALIVGVLRRKPAPVVVQEPDLPALERALRVVDWARDGDAEERRQALELLAAEVDASHPQLAGDARRLGWSRTPPSPDDLAQLARRVREADEAPA